MGNQSGKHLHHIHPSGRPKKNVHWKSAERPAVPGRPVLMPPCDQQPDVVRLRWERPKLDGGSPITGYVVEHRRMGSPHWVRATPEPVPFSEVSISGLEPGWRYQFRAFAENIVGRSDASELSDALTVTLQRNAISVPRFAVELHDVEAVENERTELRVRVLGQPPPEISWFKDGYEIFSSRRTKIINDNDTSVLIIHQVALTDDGEIRCTATNRAGHVVTRARLLVEAPPKIRLPRAYEDGIIVEAGDVLRLKVGIAGQPPPIVMWLYDGDVINVGNVDQRYEFTDATSDRNAAMLKITNVQRSDRGEYGIRASNRLGEDITSLLVTVTARPSPPGRVQLSVSFGRTATLTWCAPRDDGGCKIGSYIVEYFRVGWNVWLKAATTRILTATLNDLIEGSEYKFRVKAENPYGVSEPSDESDVLFIPDVRRGIVAPKTTTTTAAATTAAAADRPTPPRRKMGASPVRRAQQDAATETGRALSPHSVNVATAAARLQPQLLDSEDLHHEMSYGTSDHVLRRDSRKSPLIGATGSAQTAKALLANGTTRSTLRSSPVLAIKSKTTMATATVTATATTTVATTKEETTTVTTGVTTASAMRTTAALQKSTEPIQLGANQNVRNFLGHALSPAKDVTTLAIAIALGHSHEAANAASPRTHEVTDIRKESEDKPACVVETIVPRLTLDLPSPVATTSLPTPVLTSITTSSTLPTTTSTLTSTLKPRPTPLTMASSTTTPITTPTSGPITDKHDDVHTSNEFMLVVFDKNSKVTEKNEDNCFDLDLEEALHAPPINLSAPELSSLELNGLHNLPLRRSVSSTELLYERAMARFYEAVELEEAQKMHKLQAATEKMNSTGGGSTKVAAATATAAVGVSVRKRLGSMSEAERLSFERRSELRRQSSELAGGTELRLPSRWTSIDDIAATLMPTNKATAILATNEHLSEEEEEEEEEDEDVEEEKVEEDQDEDEEDVVATQESASERIYHDYDLGSDYTESTDDEDDDGDNNNNNNNGSNNNDDDSIEKFKRALLARTRSPSPRELETYHPRDMSAGIFTPCPTASPLLASVDFVPKPILKRPSSENVRPSGDEVAAPLAAVELANSEKSLAADFTKGLKSFFKRERKTAPLTDEVPPHPPANTAEVAAATAAVAAAAKVADMDAKRRAKEEEERKRQDAERIMREESQAAADHYSDLVRQVSVARKYQTPLYLDRDELQKRTHGVHADEEADEAEATAPAEGGSPLTKVPESNGGLDAVDEKMVAQQKEEKEKEKEREKALTVTTSGNITTTTITTTTTTTITSTTTTMTDTAPHERSESRGRTRVTKVKRIVKKRRTPSATRSNVAIEPATPPPPGDVSELPASGRRRLVSRTRGPQRGASSKSPTANARRRGLNDDKAAATDDLRNDVHHHIPVSPADVHNNVRSLLSYTIDVGLFVVACYVYLFKDAALVLPILALMIYRQLGEALKAMLPAWLHRRKN